MDDTGGAGRLPGHDRAVIAVIAGDIEESPRTREGRVAAATLEQEMGRRSVAEAIRPIKERAVASSSSAERSITQEMVAEACDTLPARVAQGRWDSSTESTGTDGRDRSSDRASPPAAEDGVDAQT